MTVLAVSNNPTLLEKLYSSLTQILTDAEIVCETDSLMAGKYSFNNNIDILIADVNTKRMGGVELIKFVRRERHDVLSYLIVPQGEANDFPFLTSDEVSGIIEEPLSVKALREALKSALLQ